MTPFHIVYGREPPSLISYSSIENDPPNIALMLQQRDQVLQKLKQNLLRPQERMRGWLANVALRFLLK